MGQRRCTRGLAGGVCGGENWRPPGFGDPPSVCPSSPVGTGLQHGVVLPFLPSHRPPCPGPRAGLVPESSPHEEQVLVSGVVLGHAGWEAAIVGVGVGERHGKTGESCSCRTRLLQPPHRAALRNHHSVSAASCTQGQPAPAGQEHVPPPPSIPFGFSFPWPKPQERSHIVRARRGTTRMRLRSHVFTRCKASYKSFILSRTFPTSLQGYRSAFSV